MAHEALSEDGMNGLSSEASLPQPICLTEMMRDVIGSCNLAYPITCQRTLLYPMICVKTSFLFATFAAVND